MIGGTMDFPVEHGIHGMNALVIWLNASDGAGDPAVAVVVTVPRTPR